MEHIYWNQRKYASLTSNNYCKKMNWIFLIQNFKSLLNLYGINFPLQLT